MQMHLMRKYGGCRLAEYQWFDKVHGWQDNATIGKLSGSQEPNGFLSTVGTQSCRPKEVFVRLFAEARNNQKLTKSQISDTSGKLVCRSHTGILSVSCMEKDDGTDRLRNKSIQAPSPEARKYVRWLEPRDLKHVCE